MLKIILVLLAFTSPAQAIRSPEACVEAIKAQYNRGKSYVYSIQPLKQGRGKYATHYYYEIKYVSNFDTRYTKEGCTERVYCASYAQEVFTEIKYCGR